jgi:hypothetical protein
MAKQEKSVVVGAAKPDQVMLKIGPRGVKAALSANTKWPAPAATNTAKDGSTGGNAATLAAIAALGATFTREQYVEACAARNHKGFASYALRNMWVVPA